MAIQFNEQTEKTGLSGAAIRQRIRAGDHTGHTAGLAAGKLQCNLAILPEAFALPKAP